MQYISPLRLFEHGHIPYTGDIDMPRMKKQLLAEFNLVPDGYIQLDKYIYNKNDLLQEIERPDLLQRLTYHIRIWENKQMLGILEDNQPGPTSVWECFSSFTGDPAFDVFFSPYFASSFSIISRRLLQSGELEELGSWLSYEEFLLPAERDEAFRSIRIFLEEDLRLLRNTSTENYTSMRPKLSPWLKKGWSYFFNKLPEEYFDYKQQFAIYLVNLTVKIQKSNKRDCRVISRELVKVQGLPEHLRGTIVGNNAIYDRPFGLRLKNGWGLAWLIFILLRVLATGGCFK